MLIHNLASRKVAYPREKMALDNKLEKQRKPQGQLMQEEFQWLREGKKVQMEETKALKFLQGILNQVQQLERG